MPGKEIPTMPKAESALKEIVKTPFVKDSLAAHFANLTGLPLSSFPDSMPAEFGIAFNNLANAVDTLIHEHGVEKPDVSRADGKRHLADYVENIIHDELIKSGSRLAEIGNDLKMVALREEQKKFPGPSMIERQFASEFFRILSVMAMTRLMQKFNLDPGLFRLTPEEILRNQAESSQRFEAKGGQLVDMVMPDEDPKNIVAKVKGEQNLAGNNGGDITLH